MSIIRSNQKQLPENAPVDYSTSFSCRNICLQAIFPLVGFLSLINFARSNNTLQFWSNNTLQSLENNTLQSLENNTLQFQDKSPTCLEILGKNGTWVPSEGYRYITPLNEGAGNIDRLSGQNSFLPVTQWQWHNIPQQCQIQQMTKTGLCNVMKQLGLRGIFFVGDSLSFMMSQSMWKLLEYADDPGNQWGDGYIRSVKCNGNNSSFTFDISFVRNDHLTREAVKKCSDRCNSWFDKYLSTKAAKVLLVANTGLHTYSTEQYQKDFDSFIRSAQIIKEKRPKDIIVFRTSVPGHENCMKHTIPIISNQYVTSYSYHWNLIKEYNAYTMLKLSNFSIQGHMNIHLLDVYGMTLLRPDGHRSKDDCLHYALPGPPDFWNHLLYSNLLHFV